MATFEKRETNNGTTFKAIVRVKGFPAKRKTFKRLTDAKEWAKQLEVTMMKGEFVTLGRDAQRHTVRDLVKICINMDISSKKQKTRDTEAGFLNWWVNAIGDYALPQVTPELISQQLIILQSEGLKNGKGDPTNQKSRRTIKYYRDIMDRAFKKAIQLRWIAKNPFDEVDSITKLNNERIRFLDDDERARVLLACKQSENKDLYAIVIFAISTGARKGEILKLTWKDVDLERSQAILHKTKNGETRSVPIVSHLKEILLVKKENKRMDTDLLFPRKDGLKAANIRKTWETALKKAEVIDFRFHDLRHCAASYLAMNGATLSEIAAVLGHKTLQMVKRYSHISEQHTTQVVTKMNDKIFGSDGNY